MTTNGWTYDPAEQAWTVSARSEIVGRAASYRDATRGCLNDMGRLLIIHDPAGRIAALFRDGKEVSGE